MANIEFEIIRRFFVKQPVSSQFTQHGIGDDAAVSLLPSGYELVQSIDLLNEGIHFPESTSAYDVGYKALAVSLSDIASMGAKPYSVLLTLSLPEAEFGYLQQFAEGFFSLAEQHQVELIGGDVTRGPLSVATLVNGVVPKGQALLRSSAQVNDLIYVTGSLGDSGLALAQLAEEKNNIDPYLLTRLNRPTPRVTTGLVLRDLASSAMDISDGLLTDLEKLCDASGVGAEISAELLPLSQVLQSNVSHAKALEFALSAGDDYELLFTVPEDKKFQLEQAALTVPVHCIGKIVSKSGVEVKDKAGNMITLTRHGYDHFEES